VPLHVIDAEAVGLSASDLKGLRGSEGVQACRTLKRWLACRKSDGCIAGIHVHFFGVAKLFMARKWE
jgi:hypothetical protein